MKTAVNPPAMAPGKNRAILPKIFAASFGALLGLALLKFGNPVTMENLITWPLNIYEWILSAWPAVVGYWLLAVVMALGLVNLRGRKGLPLALTVLPLVWLLWQFLSAMQSESPNMSWPAVIHFSTCVACFYLGLFALNRKEQYGWFWAGIVAGFFLVILSGLQQHFGGLKESQHYWMTYVYPTQKEVPPDFLKKMNSSRIFSTLFYPNSLAGVILILLPITLALLQSLRGYFTLAARGFLMAMTGLAALGCLIWSGSKGGWLLMLIEVIVAAMFLPMKRQFKVWLIVAVLGLGLTGFTIRYLGYFKRGATSVGARFDYWRAALQTVRDEPVFGNGPGTFAKAYAKRKSPEAEMAKLAHNDYLQQASDSGVPGFLAYSAWVVGTLVYAGRKGRLKQDWIKLAVWLGLLGWAMQSLMEFGLYIPAIAWLAFTLMGWLLGQGVNELDRDQATS